ncbi:hypothetical protein SDC9_92402 [bioreactor metagenome]|uniref:Uncharacterized protein n=1 Tax=bioreactor metagenome TaxID=1076179 RepID=A0A645A0F5_9ZZZZ
MEPEIAPVVAEIGLALGNLVGMMRKGVVDAAAMDIQILAQMLHGDSGALDVPAGIAHAPGRVPFQRLILKFGLGEPEDKIVFVPLVDILLHALPDAHRQIVRVVVIEHVVPLQLGGVEIHIAARRIRVPGIHQSGDDLDILVDAVGGGLHHVGPLDVQLTAVVKKRVGIILGDLQNGLVLPLGTLEHLVFTGVRVAGQMAHIGDIHDTLDVVPGVPQILFQHVLHDIAAQVSDVGKVIDCGAAGVHFHDVGVIGFEFFFFVGGGVVKIHGSGRPFFYGFQLLFQRVHPLEQGQQLLLNRVLHIIDLVHVVGKTGLYLPPADPHHLSRDAHGGGVGRDLAEHHGPRRNTGVVSYGEGSQDLRAGTHHHVVSQGRVALSLVFSGTAQRHALVQQAVVSDLGGLTDDNAHAVIDDKALADARAGVNLDAGPKTTPLGHAPGQKLHVVLIEKVGNAVIYQRVNAGVEQKNLQFVAGRGVAALVGIQQFRQTVHIQKLLIIQNVAGKSIPGHRKAKVCIQSSSEIKKRLSYLDRYKRRQRRGSTLANTHAGPTAGRPDNGGSAGGHYAPRSRMHLAAFAGGALSAGGAPSLSLELTVTLSVHRDIQLLQYIIICPKRCQPLFTLSNPAGLCSAKSTPHRNRRW